MRNWLLLILRVFVLTESKNYYGSYLGDFEPRFHNVRGQVYAVDSKTVFVKGFTYDGQGPDAFFYGGSTSLPSVSGFRIPNEKGALEVLQSYESKDIVLNLPNGKLLRDIKWISVWCVAFEVNFGEINFPATLEYPKPQKIPGLAGDHDVASGRIVVVDAQTFLIPNFSYDGSAPDAHFWVGKGSRPGPEGTLVLDENGSNSPLGKYDQKTLVIVLPDDLTVFDIDWLSIWCVAFYVDFGSISIPKNLNVPPSLRMLGIEPQSKLNCEVLSKDRGFEVRWAIAGKSIVAQLVGRLIENEYMSFGLSANSKRSEMNNADVTVAWMDKNSGKGYAEDYILNGKSQCSGGKGACPDDVIEKKSNSVKLLNSAHINAFTMLTYRRLLTASDPYDLEIFTNQSQAIVWAIGPLNDKKEVSYHTKHLEGTSMIEFARIPFWNCPLSNNEDDEATNRENTLSSKAKVEHGWLIPPIQCSVPKDGIFFAQIGPSGGSQGYSYLTGRVGWGIAWYINGLLIPEIYVVRGKEYTFIVEGGNDPNSSPEYHPFYITDDPEGGYQHKTEEQKQKVRVFSGINLTNNEPEANAVGRFCQWKENSNKSASEYSGFGSYQRSLKLKCHEGKSGILKWTPDASTPDTVYYQCYTHRFLGWKIHVVDKCNE